MHRLRALFYLIHIQSQIEFKHKIPQYKLKFRQKRFKFKLLRIGFLQNNLQKIMQS
jgi:hypothetical protein